MLTIMHSPKFAYFKGLRLFFLSNFPEATFIQGATPFPDSTVHKDHKNLLFSSVSNEQW